MSLNKLDISPVGQGGHCDNKVIHIGEYCTLFYHRVEWREVDDKKQRGDGGALGGADGYWGEGPGRALEKEAALPVSEEAADPRG